MPTQVALNGHIGVAIRSLLESGWRILSAPSGATIRRNGQCIQLASIESTELLRIFAYKVTGSGRNTPERRLEITSTYEKGLSQRIGYSDVVLGYEPHLGVFVGVDPRRIRHGGRTGNASSFIDAGLLSSATADRILVGQRPSQLFGLEYQAYFQPARLAEYLSNFREIHIGSYDGTGAFSGRRRPVPRASVVLEARETTGNDLVLAAPADLRASVPLPRKALEAFARNDHTALARRRVSPAQLARMNRRLQEIGLLGEQYVLRREARRLARAGQVHLAAKIQWVSQQWPFEGYDIRSFETDGSQRYIEVKATVGGGSVFPMSDHEWQVAAHYSRQYFVYRVAHVERRPALTILRDPIALEREGVLQRSPLTWNVSVLQ